LLSSSTLATTRGLRPALFLDFLSGSLDSRVGFSRGTNATMVDSTGRIVYAPANLLLRSEEFDNAAWTKINATVAANNTTSPDGTLNADLVTVTGASGRVVQNYAYSAATHTFSVYMKASATTDTLLRIVDVTPTTFTLTISWSAGVPSFVSNTGSGFSIQNAGNGWYRISITATTAAGAGSAQVFANGFNSSGASFIWGAQLEPVTYQTAPGPYVATTASAYYGPRFDYNPFTLGALGLLIEEQRTNLLTYSAEFDNAAWTKSNTTITSNSTTAPDGTVSADTIVAAGTTSAGLVRNFASTATAHTFSVYLKQGNTLFSEIEMIDQGTVANRVRLTYATGVLSVVAGSPTGTATSVGDGWWRVTITYTFPAIGATDTLVVYPSTTTGSIGENVFAWGAQLEAGAFATSYIPTVASQVTRNADVASMTGTNFSGWYNQTEGTLVADMDSATNVSLSVYVSTSINDGTVSNRIETFTYSGRWGGRMFTAGANQFDLQQTSSYTANIPAKVALAYAANDFAVSVDGNTALTDTSGSVPTVNQLNIGTIINTNYLNGHIRQIAYFNTRLPNAQLQTLSSPSLVPTLVLDFTASSYASGY
jgi:hypothetical protein